MAGLKKGFTTGTCAQAAAKASAIMLTTGKIIDIVDVTLPCGKKLNIPVIDQYIGDNFATCGVIKDAGDDPDVTNRAKIYAKIELLQANSGIIITGGKGVGIVTKPGLPVKVGEYAINPIPRKMIYHDVSAIIQDVRVTISVPDGEKLAKRTFNPRLGIIGGISILGTTGIVEPKSVDAYKISLSIQLDIAKACGINTIALVPGYVGEQFCKEELGLMDNEIVKIGDYVGFMLKKCVEKGIKEVMLIGHIGKLSKIAAGMFNTHSKFGDARMETISAYAAACGADKNIIKQLLNLNTAEASVEILKKHNLLKTFDEIAKKVVQRADEFVQHKIKIRCIILSMNKEIIGRYPKCIKCISLE
jgi:cobalt-precorrin-5B (C1)-methyltransferase